MLPEILRTHSKSIASDTEWASINRGINRETVADVLRRAPGAARELGSLSGARYMVILAGTNDSKKGGQLTLDQWESLYRQILHWPRMHGTAVICCTYPRVIPSESPEFTHHSIDFLRQASGRVRAIAAELDRFPVAVRVAELEDMPSNLLCDGVHAKKAGYAWIAQRVAEAIIGQPISALLEEEPDPPPLTDETTGDRLVRRRPRRRVVSVGDSSA